MCAEVTRREGAGERVWGVHASRNTNACRGRNRISRSLVLYETGVYSTALSSHSGRSASWFGFVARSWFRTLAELKWTLASNFGSRYFGH